MLRSGIKHVVSVSGGKDSTAALLIALERFRRDSVVPIFCDTGNEHQITYNYLEYLEQELGISIVRLRANFDREIAAKRMFIARDARTKRAPDGRCIRWSNKAKRRALDVLEPTGNPFLDLCLLKGRFPSRRAQFCTQQLKRDVAISYQIDLVDAGHTVVSWQGIRRDESQSRRNAKRFEKIGPSMYAYRPIVDWTVKQVFDYCAARGVQPNPLYKQGMTRVGCMPCINVNKAELRQIAARLPEHITRIDEWEKLVSAASKIGHSTFLHEFNKGGDECKATDADVFAKNNIWRAVEWSRTSRGGKQFYLLGDLIEPSACASTYGLCE